ncbi:MAG: ABC transporter permease [Verrucomicrobia bacterium]|nr:ABC transporter permease [Verrucomicrobiota bacterium]MBU1733704.1 ABC transporter permease [Verrucomicrobiota bacterium]MBU1858051.1 ABC transporter permease [Verrucomicrobiota bacterium]
MKTQTDQRSACRYSMVRMPDGALELVIEGRLASVTLTPVWRDVFDALARAPVPRVVVQAGKLTHCDGAGIYFFMELRRRQQAQGRAVDIRDFPPDFQHLLDLAEQVDSERSAEAPSSSGFLEETGCAAVRTVEDVWTQIAFVGELVVALVQAVRHPRHTRWRDAWLIVEKAGVNALPIVVMIGGLMGLILAFQSAIPLRRFGADIFVANLVSLSLLRELGPLMTAIILAGRSGAAFAAEIGTMKVDEELNALTTMGLDPVRFLVVTRVMAAILVMPLLTLFADLFGLIGAAIVTCSLGYPLITFKNQVLASVHAGDLLSGLLKSMVFGLLIGSVGCLRGLQTRSGASAVGDAATRAVVSGIILIVIADGLFAVMFYFIRL